MMEGQLLNWKQTGVVLIASFCVRSSRADELLYSYEAHVLPYDPSAGWIGGAPCEFPCTESVERGRFVLRWAGTGHFTVYGYRISSPPQPHPPSLWVEWHFKSNHPLGSIYYSCDAAFLVDYANVHQKVYMYGDATISGSGDIVVRGLDIDEFHTYRLESSDGVHFRISVDGLEFMDGGDLGDNGYSSIRLEGGGGCFGEDIPDVVNMWDFVRYGTMAYNEKIVESYPPAGFVDARRYAPFSRFRVRYDSPNYVYIDEIAVQTTWGPVPVVTKTRRLGNWPSDVVEIVLDRPIPYNATTRFTFDDGAAVNVVEFTFAPGDTDGDGDADLFDFSAYQNCLGSNPLVGACLPLDVITDGELRGADFAKFMRFFSGP